MPIYEYRCEACGHALEALQKMSEAPLTDCPECGAPALKKQVSAAGFQLKGSGWYVPALPYLGTMPDGKPADAGGADAKPAGDAAAKSETKEAGTSTATPKPGDGLAKSKTTNNAGVCVLLFSDSACNSRAHRLEAMQKMSAGVPHSGQS